MSTVTVKELELLSFFEIEPERVDRDIPWPYNEFTYRCKVDQCVVTFRFAPAYGDIFLLVSHRDKQIYTLRSSSIQDVRYHKDADKESLEIVISEKDRIWFRLRPAPAIFQDTSES